MPKAKSDVFLSVFATEYVEIVSDLEITTSIEGSEDGHVIPIKTPLTVAGFVMDVDDRFVYLSSDGENINQAVPSESIKHVAIIDLNAQLDQIVDEGDMPEDGGSYH